MLDRKDRQILQILQKNSKTTNLKISQDIDLAPSGTLKRIKAMENANIIQGYSLDLDPARFGYHYLAYVFIKTSSSFPKNVSNALIDVPGVLEVHAVSGEYSFLIKILTKDNDDFLEAINQINDFDSVLHTNTTIVVKTLSQTNKIVIDSEPPAKK